MVLPPDRRPGRLRTLLHVLGELLITAELVLLFVFYSVWVTDWFTTRNQAEASDQLQVQWQHRRRSRHRPRRKPGADSRPLHIPALGLAFRFAELWRAPTRRRWPPGSRW
ncbi:hypothetical protein [Saccharopolyspora spinosa]|uniref:Uncharacterized protein n=1 Tax=Saccharopolyspora spinosa TaxID=60894 RepID=A0A2N3XS57_SACSN|nr:hypothetical protein [Saccharopolyspora spinosa]PKW13503.1 hypothetical protein A8926_1038 [Saccharopolyspora spinosa]